LVAACLAALALSGCSSSKPEPVATGSSPSTTTASSAAAVPNSDRELEALLVATVPGGFVLQPDDVGDTGPSDLAKAVRDDPAPETEQALQDEGFVRGYQRLWIGPADAEIIVFVYQFATPAGAEADFDRSKGVLTDGSLPGATSFAVDGIPAAQSAAAAGSEQDVSAAAVQFHTGVFNVQVVCNGILPQGLQPRASSIAKDQFTRL
jgi:hypothetical protein